jgi:hypothetical protein
MWLVYLGGKVYSVCLVTDRTGKIHQTNQMNQPGFLAIQSAIDVPADSVARIERCFAIAFKFPGFLQGWRN